MSRDLPRGDRNDIQEEQFQEPPNCPRCPGQPLVKRFGRWWCRNHRGFVKDSEIKR